MSQTGSEQLTAQRNAAVSAAAIAVLLRTPPQSTPPHFLAAAVAELRGIASSGEVAAFCDGCMEVVRFLGGPPNALATWKHAQYAETIVANGGSTMPVYPDLQDEFSAAVGGGGAALLDYLGGVLLECAEAVAAIACVVYWLSIGNSRVSDLLERTGAATLLLTALKQHAANDKTVQCVAEAIHALSWSVRARSILAQGSAPSLLVNALQHHAESPATVESVAVALGALYRVPDHGPSAVAHAGTIQLIVGALRRHLGTAIVAMNFARVMAILSRCEENIAPIALAGAIPMLVFVIERHKNRRTAVAFASASLSFLSTNPLNFDSNHCADATRAIFAALEVHIEVSDVAVICLMGLVSMIKCKNENQAFASIDGAIPRLVNVLRVQWRTPNVVRSVAWLLHILSSRHDCDAIVRAGALQLLVDALRLHKCSACVVIEVVELLGLLSTDNDRHDDIVGAGAIPVLAEALRFHADVEAEATASPLKGIIRVLNNLAFTAVSRAEIVLVAAIPVVDALRIHLHTASVVRFIARLLCQISFDEDSCSTVAQAGAIPLLANALDRHGGDEALVNQVVAALNRLSCSSDHRCSIVRAGVVECLVDALDYHREWLSVVLSVADALCSLSVDADIRKKIVFAGAIPALMGALDRHRKYVDVMPYVMRTLREHALSPAAMMSALHCCSYHRRLPALREWAAARIFPCKSDADADI